MKLFKRKRIPKRFKQIENLFVHMGQREFYPEQVDRYMIDNFSQYYNKPGDHCLWASPVQSKNNWKKYLNEYSSYLKPRTDKSFYFSLSGRVKIINKAKDLRNLEILVSNHHICWNRVALRYDAVIFIINPPEIFKCKDKFYNQIYRSMRYAFDVDSVIVFNPDCVHVLDHYDGIRKAKIIKRKIRQKEKEQR